jgi:hypothetical protein
MLNAQPLVHSDPSSPSRQAYCVQLDVLQILWLLANPITVRYNKITEEMAGDKKLKRKVGKIKARIINI